MAEIIIRSRDTELRAALDERVDWNVESQVWARVMRNRIRWVNTPEALAEIYEISARLLEEWGFDVEALRSSMRGVEIVEIELPVDHAAIDAMRTIPWEFILSAAITGKPGLADAPLILRHVLREKRAPAASTAPPSVPALFIQSAPGRIADRYQFDSEYALVREALPDPPWTVTQLKDPDLAEITRTAAELKPAFVHITGVDVRQGAAILGSDPPGPGATGLYLRAATGEPVAHSSPEIAGALVAADRAPTCVSLNVYHSSELAAALVDAGADSAIGFLAEFDDATAEVFFSSFFRAVAASPGASAILPFRRALESLLRDPATAKHVEGAPIVIWTTASVREEHEEKVRAVAAKHAAQEPLTHAQVRAALYPYIDFPREINYCGIHNGHSIFSAPARLGIRNPEQRSIQGLSVDVTLSVSGDRAIYSRTLEIDRTNHPVDCVCLSLTSEMVRALRERMQANLTVEFSYEGRPLLRETQQVGLLATDEWDSQSPWLPSFVLPRDPAVVTIVRWAQPFLNAIADASDAGFDNYQRAEGEPATKAKETVDQQVRALWWAVRHRGRLSYLAAAPVYTANAQRIRTPSAVLNGRAGTCLDLALLFTACLAAINLHAVVFVLKNHALPGYLRSREGHTDLTKLMSSYSRKVSESNSASAPRTPWILGSDCFQSVLDLIGGDRPLVALETVALTEQGSFKKAIDRGSDRLQQLRPDEFVGLYDLTLARRHGVTPLPIAGLI